MKKILVLLASVCVLAPSAFAANFFCDTDANFINMVNCLLNETRTDCETAYPNCDIDSWLVDASDPVSEMIDLCCKPGKTDAQWDACFKNHLSKITAAKALPLKFRKHIRAKVLAYIADPELECTEH